MRIRFRKRQETPIVLRTDRKKLSARTWHSSLLLRLSLPPRSLRTRDASSLHSVRRVHDWTPVSDRRAARRHQIRRLL